MELKIFSKQLLKSAMTNGGANFGFDASKQTFDTAIRQHEMAHNQAMNWHMNTMNQNIMNMHKF